MGKQKTKPTKEQTYVCTLRIESAGKVIADIYLSGLRAKNVDDARDKATQRGEQFLNREKPPLPHGIFVLELEQQGRFGHAIIQQARPVQAPNYDNRWDDYWDTQDWRSQRRPYAQSPGLFHNQPSRTYYRKKFECPIIGMCKIKYTGKTEDTAISFINTPDPEESTS